MTRKLGESAKLKTRPPQTDTMLTVFIFLLVGVWSLVDGNDRFQLSGKKIVITGGTFEFRYACDPLCDGMSYSFGIRIQDLKA